MKNLLQEAVNEEIRCKEWVEPERKNLSQRSAAFVDKKVGNFMIIIKEMVEEYKGMERKVEQYMKVLPIKIGCIRFLGKLYSNLLNM